MKSPIWPALALGSATATFWCWQLPTRRLALEVLEVAGDQVRITWNRESAPALLAPSGAVEIQDGAGFHRVLLTGEQVRQGSLVYRRETPDVRVRLRIDSGERWAQLAPVLDTARFQGSEVSVRSLAFGGTGGFACPGGRTGETACPTVSPMPPAKNLQPEPQPAVNTANRATPPRKLAVIPDTLPQANAPTDPLPEPPAPSLAIFRPAVAAPALALAPPPGVTPVARRPVYSGPRYGRIIWTGSMGRRGVVEIEGAHSSIGAMTGGLPGVPVTLRVSPAEFSPQGLVVHTTDGSANGRMETASATNGWNATLFRWEPDRASDLVVLEAPNPSNDFKRLAVRNDARTCAVMLVEWTVR